MRFSAIVRGKTAEREISYRYADKDVTVIIRPLTAMEQVDVASSAIRFAKERGADPKSESPIYEEAEMAHTIELSCMDPDSPPESRTKHFDTGVSGVLSLDTDTIAYLFEQQRIWQEECSPSRRPTTITELFDLARALGVEDDTDPKVRQLYSLLPSATRWSLTRTMAVLLRSSQVLKSSGSSSSGATTAA